MQLNHMQRPKKILLINPFGIGDVLFTTPIIHTLKDALPETKIGYLSNRRTEDILKNNPYLDYIFVYERDEFEDCKKKTIVRWLKEMLSFLNSIKKEHFDIAFDFSLNTQFGFFSWYAGIPKRIGYNFKGRGFFLTSKIPLSGYKDRHMAEHYAALLKEIGLNLKYNNMELYINEQDKQWARDALQKEGVSQEDYLIGIIPGGGKSWGKEAYRKQWAPQRFAALADKIVANKQSKIIIMGDFSEQDIAEKVITSMKSKAIDFSGKTTLGQLAALLSRMRLVVTNDGGPLHMAAALGVKTVSIFGPVDERVYGPYPVSDRNIVIKSNISCRPCYHNFRIRECLRQRQCLEGITVGDVYKEVEKMI